MSSAGRDPALPRLEEVAGKFVDISDLNKDLTCPICLGIIRNATVVMECLHRFCNDCIRLCPVCITFLISAFLATEFAALVLCFQLA